MIVRAQPSGELLLIGQTDHSRLVGQFAAHWGNERFAVPEPYESVARAAAFHDYGWLRYETAPAFDGRTHETPNFREIGSSAQRLAEHEWCFDWLLGGDPYAGALVNMHRTGLLRGRYGTIELPAAHIRSGSAATDAFVARNEARRERMIAEHGWDAERLQRNYRLLQVWDLLGLFFACAEPEREAIAPVPVGYGDGPEVRLDLTPLGERAVSVEPFPFDERPCRVQLAYRRLPQTTFADRDTFRRAYFRAPLDVMEFVLT